MKSRKSELSEFDDEFAGGFLAVLSLFLGDLAVLGADASFGVVDREATGHDDPRPVFLGESALRFLFGGGEERSESAGDESQNKDGS